MYRLILLVLLLFGCGCPQEYRTTVRNGGGCYNSTCNNRQPTYSAGPFSCSPRSNDYSRTEFRCWDGDFIVVFCDGRNRWSRPGCYAQGDFNGLRCDITHVCQSGW